jgi:hypothetical protein
MAAKYQLEMTNIEKAKALIWPQSKPETINRNEE